MSRGLGYGIILALGLGLGSPLQAQVVRGTLTEVGDRVPLEGAVISLLPETENTPVAMTLSDATGRFDFAATPGRWSVRAEIIGHATVRSAPFELAEGEDVVLELVTPVEAVSLAQVDVTAADRRCTVRPDDEGLATAVAWEQARKALEGSLLGQEGDRARFGAILYERELEPGTMRVTQERTEPYHAAGARPFSGASPEDLAMRGFVQETDSGTYYFAPDERVLLSDVFLDGHCFRLRRADEHPGLVGLAFEPIEGGSRTDIEGVVWLDRETGELRSLDYRYVRLRLGVPTEELGGGMRFQRLPTGTWIPWRWWIRMPVIEVRTRRVFGREREDRVLSGILERGGEVLSVEVDGTRLEGLDRPRVQGMVYDSTSGRPLEGARVLLVGTGHATRTDARGRFVLNAPEGDFDLSFDHPRLDSLGVRPGRARVSLRPEAVREVRLAIPSAASVLRQSCAATDGAVLSGVVRDSIAPLPAARVRMVWSASDGSPRSRSTSTDDEGRFVFCGAPVDTELLAWAARAGRTSEALRLRTTGTEVVTAELVVDTLRTSELTGRVTDASTGQPLPQTVIRLRDTGLETLSDAGGAFTLSEVPPGRRILELEHPFYGLQSDELQVEPGSSVSLTVVIRTGAIELDPLTVTVEARRTPGEAGFFARRERGMGFFLVEEQIRRIQAIQMNDLFNAVPGLSVACGQSDVLESGCRVQFERARSLDRGGRERPCPVQYFLDGSPVSKATVDALRPTNVLGIEVYNGLSEVPPEFRRGPDTRCGTISVWLKARR